MPKVDPIDIELPGATDERIEEAIKEYLQNNPAIGKPGKDGFSPIAKVVQTDDGAVITITDKDGTTEVVITNGKNGYTPKKGIDYDDGKSAYEYAKEGGYTGTETEFSEKLAKEYPEKVSQLENDSQYINAAGAPVQSINGKTGKVQLGAADVGARPFNWMPTAAEVGALPDTYVPPDQTAAQVGADPAGTATAAVSTHNTSTDSHGDLRLELKAISDRLTAFFDSDNQTLDELSEIVAYITSNKALIDSITTSKVSVTDIINNLTTNVANKPLSAAQGVALKGLIDAVSNSLSNYQPKGDYALASAIPTKVSQLQNDKGYLTEHQDISGKLDADKLPEAVNAALAQAKDSGEFDGDPGAPGVTPHIGANGSWYIGSNDTGVKAQGKDGTSVTVKSVSESTADGGSNVVTFSDGTTVTIKNGQPGAPGKDGTSGVYIGETEPTDPDVMVWIKPDDEMSYPVFNEAYIRGCELVANDLAGISSSQGQYTGVKMGANITKVMCKAKFYAHACVALITTNLGSSMVSNITNGSLHLVFDRTTCAVGVFNSPDQLTGIAGYTYNIPEGEVVSFGFDIDEANNKLTIYLPDGTTKTVSNAAVSTLNGQYAIWEHFCIKTNYGFASCKLTKLYCKDAGGEVLDDDLLRLDGAIGVAPTGQTYRQFTSYNSNNRDFR
jgi:hypothetical protein